MTPKGRNGSLSNGSIKKNTEVAEIETENLNYDKLLEVPESFAVQSETNKLLDKIDEEIKIKEAAHQEKMATLEREIELEKKRRLEWKQKRKSNATLRDRIQNELTERVIKEMFTGNKTYLEGVWSGEVESCRHKAFHGGIRSRQALYYKMITHPFTDNQVNWVLEEITALWMKDKWEQMEHNDYVWKVILPETFIFFLFSFFTLYQRPASKVHFEVDLKIYSDYFGLTKEEAETRINNTPLKNYANNIVHSSSDDD